MTDVTTVVDDYIASWNESDAERRRALISRTWTEDGSYLDPHMAASGASEIDALIAGVQERFPGARFELAGAPDHHHDRVRFTWHLNQADGGARIATGIDFGTLAEDGRLRAITGFLEPA